MKHLNLLSIFTIFFVLSCNRYTKIFQTDKKEVKISGICLGTGKKKPKKADPKTQTRTNPTPTSKEKEKKEFFNKETQFKNKNEIPLQPIKNTAYNYPHFSHPEKKRYLFLDHGGVLDGEIVMSRSEITKDDLLISTIEEGALYQVLKNGVQIIQILNKMVKNHNFELYFHTKNKEKEQLKMLAILQQECIKKGLEFPKISALFVRDEHIFANIPSDKPKIIKDRLHGMDIIGYSQEKDGKQCLRETYIYYFNINDNARKKHYILDDGPSVIAKAKAEGWNAIQVEKSNGLYEIINTIYQKL